MKNNKDFLNSYREKINSVALASSSSSNKFPDFNLGESLRSSRVIYHNHAPRSMELAPHEVKQKLGQSSVAAMPNLSEKNQILSKIPIQGMSYEKVKAAANTSTTNIHQHSFSMKTGSSPQILSIVSGTNIAAGGLHNNNAGSSNSNNNSSSAKQSSPMLKSNERSSSTNFYRDQANMFFKTLKQPNFLNNYSNLKSQQMNHFNPLGGSQGFMQEKSPAESKRTPFVNYPNLKSIRIKVKNNASEDQVHLTRNSFELFHVIGRGGFGKVWKVENKKSKTIYALKEMSKSKIISKKSVNSVMNERQLLALLKHPFLVNMHFAFQDRENLFLVMDYLSGGDLRYHIGRMRRFSEEQTRFFVACIILALEYLHSNDIIHRDIKPENLVLERNGYVRVTDLGVARELKPENSSDTSGTPGYMAPEVMCRQNHGVAVDYYAVGVLTYEFMLGRRPYLGKNRKEIRDAILAKQIQIRSNEIPLGWSIEAADFVNRMIQRKPANRLGFGGPAEVKDHPWLKDFPFDKLMRKELNAPFLPKQKEDNFDERQSVTNEATNEELEQQNMILLRRNSIQSLFNGYNFDGRSSKNSNPLHTERSNSLAMLKTTISTSGSFLN